MNFKIFKVYKDMTKEDVIKLEEEMNKFTDELKEKNLIPMSLSAIENILVLAYGEEQQIVIGGGENEDNTNGCIRD